MAVTGFTGIWPEALGNIADPSASALRVVPSFGNGYQFSGGFSVSGQSATGSGTIMDSRAFPRGVAYMRISGNSASAEILCTHDTASNIWVQVAGYFTGQYTGVTDNLIALEQAYTYLMARVSFVSASAGISAAVWIYFHRVPS